MKNKALFLGVGTAGLAFAGASEYFFNYAFKRDDSFYEDPLDFAYKGEELEKKKMERQELIEWLETSNSTEGYIKSFDSLNLHGIVVENNDTDSYVIIVHGMRSDYRSMLRNAYEFSKHGYNILLIDQRANGKSQGEFMTYGFKEGIDIAQWVDMLCKRHQNAKIALYGVSMGGASVICSLNNGLPDNVKCVVEDCGYSDLEEEFVHVMKTSFSLPAQPLLSSASALAKMRIGIDVSKISPIECLRNNEVPILFVHGTRDNFVPFDMAKKLYNANKGIKKFYPVEGKKHSTACDDPNYHKNICSFMDNYL